MPDSLWKHNVDVILSSFSSPILIADSSRRDLAMLYNKLGYTCGVEVGVAGGGFSEIICQSVPGVKLYAIDLYKPYGGYMDYTNEVELEKMYVDAQTRLLPYGVEFRRDTSSAAVRGFSDNSLDFVYIDANHNSPWIDNDIYWWSRKVKPGGIVSGHDYVGNHTDVIDAVKFYVSKNNLSPYWIVGRQGEQNEPDFVCSWFWVKRDELER